MLIVNEFPLRSWHMELFYSNLLQHRNVLFFGSLKNRMKKLFLCNFTLKHFYIHLLAKPISLIVIYYLESNMTEQFLNHVERKRLKLGNINLISQRIR